MKIASFLDASGRAHTGEFRDGRVRPWPFDILTALSLQAQGALAQAAQVEGPWLSTEGVVWLPPVPRPGKIIAMAANYLAHIREGGGDLASDARVYPQVFLKPVTAITAHEAAIKLSPVSARIDWEAELAVIIGTGGKCIPAASAMSHVAGYAIFNDVSARSIDIHTNVARRGFDDFFRWFAGKCLDGFAPVGPYLVTADEVADPHRLRIRLRRNGELMQDGSTGDMLLRIPDIIAFASTLMTLEPGDVIATGTPDGVGAARGLYLAPGDVVEIEIDGLGTLRNRFVVDDTASPRA